MIYNDYHFTVPESKMVRVITNTDAKNEADDQFAIVQTLLSPRFDNRGIIAAHFGTKRTQHSMEESYNEIQKVLGLMNFPSSLVCHGAPTALPDKDTPVDSEGARLIIEEAMKDDPRPLYVTFLGPLTDMASALLMEPRIADRMTCIWIGGGKYPDGGWEFNLNNDVPAANVVMQSTMPVWQIPRDTYSQVIVSLAELESKVRPCGKLGEYLFDQLAAWSHTPGALASPRTGEYWCLGDSPVVGVLLFSHMYSYDWIQAPVITPELHYVPYSLNRPIRVYHEVDNRFILEDFFAKLKLFTDKQQEGGN